MIPEVQRILFPTDLSDTSNFAFNYAAGLANRYGALITILHVLKDVTHSDDSLITNVIGEEKWQEILNRKKAEVIEKIRLRLENFCEEAKSNLPGCPFLMEKIIVKIGNPADEILKQIEKKDYDLLVMGAHGHGLIAGSVIGSVSRRVLRRCKKPVLLVRLPE